MMKQQIPSTSSLDHVEVVNVSRLIEARRNEISDFLNTLASGRKHNRSFQKLPYYQRRRAMSHNPFRVPKRYRLPIVIDLLAARKLRRRINRVRWRKDLRFRRFGENKWLTTHLFHAKRFKMINIWGYKLADTPTLKCQRRVYKSMSSSNGCLIYDKSYFSIYTNGNSDGFSSLNHLTNRKKMGFYDQNGCFISPIHVMTSNDHLVVSIHPCAKNQFLECVNRNVSGHKLFDNYINPREVKDVSHFELLGPRSLGILCKILNLRQFKENDYFIANDCRMIRNSSNGTIFHVKIGLPESAFNKFDTIEAKRLLSGYKHVLTKSRKSRLSTAVLEKEKLKLENVINKPLLEHVEDVQHVEQLIKYDAIIITRHMISSFRPYKRVSGFDLLIPSQLSRFIWNQLYKSGGLPIGLNERRKIYLELGQLLFPEDYPETLGGHEYHSARDEERVNRHLKLSLRHRPNYSKFKITEPLSVINLTCILSKDCDKFVNNKFIHTIIISVRRCVPRENCRVYLLKDGDYREVGFVLFGCNTFTKGRGFAKCLILYDVNIQDNKFMARNINSNHYFPIDMYKIELDCFID